MWCGYPAGQIHCFFCRIFPLDIRLASAGSETQEHLEDSTTTVGVSTTTLGVIPHSVWLYLKDVNEFRLNCSNCILHVYGYVERYE